MTNELLKEIERMVATMNITVEQAKELLQESLSENQAILSDLEYCECPMTGTIEIMRRKL